MGYQGFDGPSETYRSAGHDEAGDGRQAESERERRAKVIHAEGEFQASSRLRDAARTIEGYPMAMQMRFLQTLTEVGNERAATIVLPLPIELFSAFLDKSRRPEGTLPRTESEEEKAA